MNKIIFLLLLVFLLLRCGGIQQANLEKEKFDVHDILSKSSYLEDLNQLVDSIQLHHPQPYEFIAKENFAKLVQNKKASITNATTVSEFVWLCQSITAAVGCGHTSVSIENVLDINPAIFFPMTVRYVDAKLYVIDPLSNKASVTVGTEILSINGLDVEVLKDKISMNIPSDGYNESLQDFYANNYFRVFCAFQLGFPKEYRIVVNQNKHPKEIKLKASDENISRKNHLSNCKNNLCFEVDTANNLGIITIRSFVYYNENFTEFESFVDSSFTQLNLLGLENLVIDLRSNGGGDPFCASYLLQHISDKPFRYYKDKSTVYYRELEKIMLLHKNRFKGKPFILTNGGCFSTTGHFSSLVKTLDVGLFVGQETGATYSCNANQRTFLLKNTGVFTSIATQTYQTDVEGLKKNEGILPDYPIEPELSDILKDSDLEMEKVIHLINEK